MPLVTVTVLHYRPLARFRAFANMGRALLSPFRAEGLRFQKLLGSGINFGLVPNLSTYVFLGVWDSEQQANTFLQSPHFATLRRGTDQVGTLFLEPYHAHGLWDGVNPFTENSDGPTLRQRTANSEQPQADRRSPVADNSSPVAVLTRATIRTGALPDFWRHVPAARQRLLDHKDNLLFAIGVGERPITQQCTISVWRNRAAVEQFAYRQSGHKEVVRRTRDKRWYDEELFARFRVIRAEGFTFSL